MTERTKYRLELRHSIRKVDQNGNWLSGDTFTIEDRVDVDAGSFLELAGILGRFHDLAERINRGEDQAAEHTAATAESFGLQGPAPEITKSVRGMFLHVDPDQITLRDRDGDVWYPRSEGTWGDLADGPSRSLEWITEHYGPVQMVIPWGAGPG